MHPIHKLKYLQGMVLLHVMVIVFVLSLLSSHMVDHALLLKRRSYTFSHWIQSAITKENAVTTMEKHFSKEKSEWLGFVPDHLEYGCHDGVDLYHVHHDNIEVTFAIR